MAFRGLFIGIDRYVSPDINWLSCARRDAAALHALFTDTLGGSTTVLADEDATRAGIEAQLAELTTCGPEDVVVVSYSGHGAETHELVPYDTDVHDLANTAIPLERMADWFARIPARRLIFILDCCFSGGMGAKVLRVEGVPRAMRSVDSKLNQLSGEGRLILTAASATEEAYENPRLRHGFLTYYLLQALQGAEEVQSGGKVSVYRLLEYVTQRVIDAAKQIGRQQHPTMRGTLDGELTWPIFKPGALFHAAFPERVRAEASRDVASLAAFGFPPEFLHAWAEAIPGLNPLQLAAINEFGLLNGEHLVVSAPTSSGKTMVGELAALGGILERRRALFLLPLKALVGDKLRHFEQLYSPFGIRTIEATGETDDITPLLRGHYDIALLTYEKFAALILSHPHVLEQAGTIVIDEVQMLADSSRGANLEFILTLVLMRRRHGIEPQLIALSAVIGGTHGLERWLGARLLKRVERPVPLDEGLLLADGSFRYIDADTHEERRSDPLVHRQFGKGSSQDWVIPLVRKLVGEGKQVIVFRETKGEARGCAKYLAEALGLPPATDALARLPAGDPSQASHDLRAVLQRGVAFHNADLDRSERLVVEQAFRASGTPLRVLAATTTLAMGVNTPAEAVVIVGLEHPGPTPYSVAEYKNLVGRAGRLGYAQRGVSYLLALDYRHEHDFWTRYVLGAPEDVLSRFLDPATDARSLVVRVLAAARRTGSEGLADQDIIAFLESSFGAFQQVQLSGQWRWSAEDLRAALDELVQHRLAELDAEGRYRLTQLGILAGESAMEVASVLRLAGALAPLNSASVTDPALIAAAQLTAELDALTFPINKKSTQKEPQVWQFELQKQTVPASLLVALRNTARDVLHGALRAKKAVACLLFVSGRAMDEVERVLTQFGGADGAAGPVRQVAARTCDVLPTVARIAELLHPGLDLGARLSRLLIRLDLGIPSEAVELGRHAGNGLARGDYRRLLAAKLGEPAQIRAAQDEDLLNCLGNDVAKVSLVREAAEAAEHDRQRAAAVLPILEPYRE
ncbi:DEAD/DEAH box helicase [Myxococcus sp. Y35]|uniref:DEAD/DEAH box helicase n=1 Tax=Pseudomyxococcus flavus TaxID=3115648 RepID=UPI003CF54699